MQKPIILKRMVLGDGGGQSVTPYRTGTELYNLICTTSLTSKKADILSGGILISGDLKEKLKGQTIREVGLIDEDGDLIVWSSYPDVLITDNLELDIMIVVPFISSSDATVIIDNAGGITDGNSSSSKVFDTVNKMLADGYCKSNKDVRVSTRGYHKKSGIGGATYDIWNKLEYQELLGTKWIDGKNVTWEPDGFGDFDIPGSENVAVLKNDGVFWAGKCGLLDPVENEQEARKLGITHEQSLENAAKYVKKQIDFLHKVNGVGIRHVEILHIEPGRYVFNGTAFFPACVFPCGGSSWGQEPCVELIPMKNQGDEDNLSNYYPKPGYPILKSIWTPNFDGKPGKMAICPEYVFNDNNRGDHISAYVKLNTIDKSQVIFGSSDNVSEAGWDAESQSWYGKLLLSKNGSTENQTINFKKLKASKSQALAGATLSISKVCHLDNDGVVDRVEWVFSVLGSVVDSIVADDINSTVSFDIWGNNSNGDCTLNGSLEYLESGESWPLDSNGSPVDLRVSNPLESPLRWRYGPGTVTSIDAPDVNYIDEQSKEDANSTLTGFKDDPLWIIKTKYDVNDRSGFMIIHNSDRKSGGCRALENAYLTQYIGGASGITISNYETNEHTYVKGTMNPSGEPDLDPNWKGNYLRHINGFMSYGSGIYLSLRSERVSTLIHRPGYEALGEPYTDRSYIRDIECGIQRENDRWAIDMNGAGDCVIMENISFPVNHPSKYNYGSFYPIGEYLDGPAKAIRYHTTAFTFPNWKSYIGTSTAGARIFNVINGSICLVGTRNIPVVGCHFEFGNVIMIGASGAVTDNYFSPHRGSNYPDIDLRPGPYNNSGTTVRLQNNEFHRGYDASHWPDAKWNIITSSTYTVKLENNIQSWALFGNEGQEIAPTIGYRAKPLKGGDYPACGDMPGIQPLAGWERWAPYLTRNCTIVRGLFQPQSIERTVDNFTGINDVFNSRASSKTDGLYWYDSDKKEQYPFGKYYYNAQLLLDHGDETTNQLDLDYLPYGRNPTLGEYKAIDLERSINVGLTGNDSEPYTIPSMNFYTSGQAVPEGWVRLYRGLESGKYTHYVDVPAVSLFTLEDTGSHVYMRPWIPFDNEVDESTGTNMLPINEVGIGQWFYLKARSGAYPIDDKYSFITGKIDPIETEKHYIYDGNKSGGASESYISKTTATWHQPFNADAYCGLKITGDLDWSGSKIKIPEGASATIVRQASSTGDHELIVSYINGQGNEVCVAKLVPGSSVQCVYAKGNWTAINWDGFDESAFIVITEKKKLGTYIQQLNDPKIKNVTLVIDTDEMINDKGITDIWYSVSNDAPIGKTVTFVRTERCAGTVTANPYGWSRAIVVATDNKNIKYNIGVLNFPGDSFTIVRLASGWAVKSKAAFNDYVNYVEDSHGVANINPVDGCMRKINIIEKFVGEDPTKDMYLQLSPKSFALMPIKHGARVQVKIGEKWDGHTNVMILLVDSKSVLTPYPDNLVAPGDYLEFVWLDSNPNDALDKTGRFYLVDKSLGLSSVKQDLYSLINMADPYASFNKYPPAKISGNTYTTVWKGAFKEQLWITLPAKVKTGTIYRFICNQYLTTPDETESIGLNITAGNIIYQVENNWLLSLIFIDNEWVVYENNVNFLFKGK